MVGRGARRAPLWAPRGATFFRTFGRVAGRRLEAGEEPRPQLGAERRELRARARFRRAPGGRARREAGAVGFPGGGAVLSPFPALERPAQSRAHHKNSDHFRCVGSGRPSSDFLDGRGAPASLCPVAWHSFAPSFPCMSPLIGVVVVVGADAGAGSPPLRLWKLGRHVPSLPQALDSRAARLRRHLEKLLVNLTPWQPLVVGWGWDVLDSQAGKLCEQCHMGSRSVAAGI